MSETAREIATQPACWREAIRLSSEVGDRLPPAGGRVAVIGCGTSLFIAQAYAAAREAAGHGETDAFPASEFPFRRDYQMIVALSRSGMTTEVVRALDDVAGSVRTLAVTAVPGSPVARSASDVIALEFADEQSVVQTRFATTALALLRAQLGHDVEQAAADAAVALAEPLPADPREFTHFVFLGRGWTVGLAHEAALKFREAAVAWTESYPAMEYRHGPISVAGMATLAWALGEVEADLLTEVETTGATVVADDRDPMASLLLAQRAAVALAEGRGLDPDAPRNLSRAVVLPDG